MERAELLTRAAALARADRIYVRAMVNADGVYTVRTSETRRQRRPVDHYRLMVLASGTTVCECPGFTNRQSCKHVSALLARLAREGKVARATVEPIARDR